MRSQIDKLTFDHLDDICLGVENGSLNLFDVPTTRAELLGPLLELRHFQKPALRYEFLNRPWLIAGAYVGLLRSLETTATWFLPVTEAQGYVSIARLQQDDLSWVEFAMRAKRAAVAAGFSSDHGGKLVAAMAELYSNTIDHSEQVDSGYIAYAAAPRRFEFVVGDSGIGALSSLRKNPTFSGLSDSGSALEAALSEGKSRHYDEPGHGYGFRPLLVGLSNISQFVRFRSGDHSRELSRMEDGIIAACTYQKSDLAGFLSYVLCEI